jgi:uncharacterized BrkB/YihY/UPF0761 family membrane protein
MLLLHIVVALASIGVSTYSFFAPSQAKLRLSYALVGVTLASGTFLVVSSGAHILQTCLTGLIYVGGVSIALVGARHKLVDQKERSTRE